LTAKNHNAIWGDFTSPLFSNLQRHMKSKEIAGMNKKIRIIKVIVTVIYTLAVVALYFNFSNIGDSVSGVLAYLFLLNVMVGVWIVMVFMFATNFIEKKMIQRKLEQAEKQLGNISYTQLDSYKRSASGDFVTLRFRSCGVTKEDWENKRACVQSAINYEIIGEIEYFKNRFDVIVFDAKKGRQDQDLGGLVDDEI